LKSSEFSVTPLRSSKHTFSYITVVFWRVKPMTTLQPIDEFLRAYHAGMDEFMRGSCEGVQPLFSKGDDVTLGNPFGPVAKGRDRVMEAMERAARNYRDGEAIGFDNISTVVTPELAYLVEVERLRARVGGRPELHDLALRVTTILRLEQGGWKIVHRHADPITSTRPPESVLQS
jgi:ketosteroid isomerase-like protein